MRYNKPLTRVLTGRDYTRDLVRRRDKYMCQSCGIRRTPKQLARLNRGLILKGKKKSLDVHHLNGMCGKKTRGYDSITDMDKLITLCHKCHYVQHDFQPRLTGSMKNSPRTKAIMALYRPVDKSLA
jgi:hypothetical protein